MSLNALALPAAVHAEGGFPPKPDDFWQPLVTFGHVNWGGYEFTLVSVFDQDVLEFVNGRENVSLTPATSSSGTKITVLKEKKDEMKLRIEAGR